MQKAENSERPQVGRRIASEGEGRKPGRESWKPREVRV